MLMFAVVLCCGVVLLQIRRQTRMNEQIAYRAHGVNKREAGVRATVNVLPKDEVEDVFRDSEKILTAKHAAKTAKAAK